MTIAAHKTRQVQYLATLSLSLASVTLGVSSAWPTPVLPKLKDTNIEINNAEIGWMLAMSAPGHITGSLASRFIADRFGRRPTVLLSAIPMAIGTIIVAFAQKAWLLYVTRFLWGASTGMLALLVPMYLGEISDSEVRATLSLATRVTFNLGSLLVMSIGMFVTYECLNYMMLVLPVTYFFSCLWIPESPYFLLKRGRVDEAKKVLMRLQRNKDEKELEDHLVQMQNHVRNETRRSGGIMEFLSGRQYRKSVVIGVGVFSGEQHHLVALTGITLGAFIRYRICKHNTSLRYYKIIAGLKLTQIFTGIMVVQQYLSRILEESKITLQLSTTFIIFGVVRFVVGIMGSVLADRVGRRPLLVYSLLLTGLSLVAVSVYFFLKEVMEVSQESLKPFSFVPFAGIISTTVVSTLGYSSIIFVIPGEIFPLNVKAVALSALNIFGGLCAFTMAKGFQVLQDLTGFCGVFCVFTGVSFAGAIFTILYVPETKGKSLREIQILLQGDLYYEEGEKVNEAKGDECDNELQVLNSKDNNVNCKV